MAYTEYVDDNYPTWTQVDAEWNDSHGTCYVVSPEDTALHYAELFHDFSTPRSANVAYITVNGLRSEGGGDTPGYAYQKVVLHTPGGNVTLYEGAGDFSGALLENYDITSLMQTAGDYSLEFQARYQSGWIYESGYIWYTSSVEYDFCTLQVDTSLTTTITLNTEVVTPTDTLAVYKYTLDMVEVTTPTVSFQLEKFSPVTSQAPQVLVASSSDHKIWDFRTGTPLGHVDTPEVDFGMPGIDKVLEEVQFESQVATPHTINVYYSIDGGLTFVLIGQDIIYAGKKGFVYPWLTAESFVIRFSGTALYLFSYALYARPSAPQIRLS